MLIKEDILDNPIIYEMKENVKKSNRKTLKYLLHISII